MSTLILSFVLAQGVLHGFVREEGSGEPVPFAVVEVVGSRNRVEANERGYYVITSVQAGQHVLIANGFGFRPDTAEARLSSGASARVDFSLGRATIALPEITAKVSATSGHQPATAAGPPPVRITAPTISRVPALAEPDVLRVIQTLPSFAAASDFSTALYVRGSSPDQTIISLDGAPLFNPYHLGGLFAAIDPSAISAVEARAGALPASAPDRLAASVEIMTRDGGRDRVRSHGALGLVSSRASVDGPLPGRNGSFLVSGRRTYLDVMTAAAEAIGAIPAGVPYGFIDAHLKLTHDLGETGQLSTSAYLNRESLEELDVSRPGETWRWGTRAASIGYRAALAPTASLYLGAAGTLFDATLFGWDARPGRGDDAAAFGEVPVSRSDVRNGLLRADVAVHGRRHTLKFGTRGQVFSANHLVDARWTALGEVLPDLEERAHFKTLAAYVEDEWETTSALVIRGGLRVLQVEGREPLALPRIGFSYRLSHGLSATMGAGRYAQPVRSFRNEEALIASVFAYDLVTDVPGTAPLPTAEDLVLGVEWAGRSTSLRVEAYGKRQHDLPLVPLGFDPENAPVLAVEQMETGSGRVLGLELLGTHSGDRYDAMLSYSLSSVRRTVAGVSYIPRYHRLHLLDLSGMRKLGESGHLSVRLAAGSGQPTSTLIGALQPYFYDMSQGRLREVFGQPRVYGSHNTSRLPPYLRLDVGVRKTYERNWFGKTAHVTPFLQVLNLLNSANPLWMKVRLREIGTGVVVENGPRLPILPTLGIEWRF